MVVVLGMHRSGTSCVTGILTALGLNAGDNLLPPAPDNPKGFFEDERVMAFQEGILSQFNRSWSDVRQMPDDWVSSHLFHGYVEELRSIASGLDVVKDPRSCRLIKMWDELSPKYLVVKRNRDAVTKSLSSRNGFSLEYAGMLYDSYNEDILRNAHKYCLVNYEDVLADWRKEFSRIERELGLSFVYSDAVDDFIDASLNHNG